ncbi:MBL fold metallo-hydrolase [Nocardioides sp. R-C-SC26]|uniref:MBL fold metallo-hydrolase n=1 Tax=Nocardioides sp. R-C-SC26 TaxID=2870414 RepID=UPI001E409AD1|nr:MBL fold metallo-hydrolase [Nocardioides sp. R-C-SC26]
MSSVTLDGSADAEATVRVRIVGCSGSYPGPDSPASCYLLEAEHGVGAERRTWRILLDLGNGALGELHRHLDPRSIDGVLISHHHPDHCQDMCGFYVLRKYHPEGTVPMIPVWGPSGTADRMAHAYGLPDGPGMRDVFDFRTYDGAFQVGPFTVEPIPVYHPVEAYGLRVTVGDVVIGYSGDTAPCEGLDRVADRATLLLCEASFRDGDDNPPGIHLTGRDAGELARRSALGTLVLTHIPPWFDQQAMYDEAAAVFDGAIVLAERGAVFSL